MVRVHPEPRVIRWLGSQQEQDLALSVLTLGEIQRGISKLTDTRRQTKLMKWLQEELIMRFSERILPIQREIGLRWGELLGVSEQQGILLPLIDSLIGATALVHELTIVTRNINDFKKCGVNVLNPWET